jgi:imidazolonepropionase-like amidohydrolase
VTAWRVQAVLLPDDIDRQDRWLTRDGWRDDPVADAEDLPGRFALPGLVDAHSHLSFGMANGGLVMLDAAGAEANRDRYATEGVALVREAGGAPDVVLALPTSPDRPFIVAASRHLAPRGLYYEEAHLPAEPDQVVDIALADLAAGARWVKLVADFPAVRPPDPAAWQPPVQTYDLEIVRRVVTAAHAVGARVAAHVTLPLAADLVRLGIDSVEHGTALDEQTVAEMARRGTAWTPTLCAVLSHTPDAPEQRRRLTAERRERFCYLLPIAVRQDVPVLTGSDVVGSVPREVALLVSCGVEPLDALRAATTTAVRFLGTDLAGVPPAVVTYAADPRNHPEVLARPAAVVIGGVRVR